MSIQLVCTPRRLPAKHQVRAAKRAVAINPQNHPHPTLVTMALGPSPSPQKLSLIIGRRWPSSGVKLTVGFLDDAPADLRKRILLHMNAWGAFANVKFTPTKTDPQVRIARLSKPPAMSGYWSYLGTEILEIGKNDPTMNLEAFTMQTPESEFHRVVRHETGHTLGFPHEHMRRQLVKLIDRAKAIAFYERTQGWTEQEVVEQVLTPIEESSLLGTARADPNSIMCYQVPGSVTKNGKPIVGGIDIDALDKSFAASVYPKH